MLLLALQLPPAPFSSWDFALGPFYRWQYDFFWGGGMGGTIYVYITPAFTWHNKKGQWCRGTAGEMPNPSHRCQCEPVSLQLC